MRVLAMKLLFYQLPNEGMQRLVAVNTLSILALSTVLLSNNAHVDYTITTSTRIPLLAPRTKMNETTGQQVEVVGCFLTAAIHGSGSPLGPWTLCSCRPSTNCPTH